ncbi:beta-glucuronidase, partial [Staphylococcus arlettae]
LPVGKYYEQEAPNNTTIKKNDPNFDFFNYAGLHRPVKIYTTPQTYIQDIAIVPEVLETHAKVNYDVSVNKQAEVHVQVLDEQQQVVGESTDAKGTINIDNPTLWQPLNAYLYQLDVSIINNGTVVDTYREPFGIRSVK